MKPSLYVLGDRQIFLKDFLTVMMVYSSFKTACYNWSHVNSPKTEYWTGVSTFGRWLILASFQAVGHSQITNRSTAPVNGNQTRKVKEQNSWTGYVEVKSEGAILEASRGQNGTQVHSIFNEEILLLSAQITLLQCYRWTKRNNSILWATCRKRRRANCRHIRFSWLSTMHEAWESRWHISELPESW